MPVLDIGNLLYQMFWIVIGFPLTVTLVFASGMLAGFVLKGYFQER